jgi:hypothetical protein
MQVILTPVPVIPVEPENSRLISIGGKCIGKVTQPPEAKSCKYHVILDSKHNYSIYQGFGMTVDEALRNAIQINQARRVDELTELDELENAIWGDHELN